MSVSEGCRSGEGGGESGGGIKESMNWRAWASSTLVRGVPTPACAGVGIAVFEGGMSILFPTNTQQNLLTSSSSTGARSRNSFHHFVSASSVCGWFTSNMSNTASAPRKNADERLENLSCPAVSCATPPMSAVPRTKFWVSRPRLPISAGSLSPPCSHDA